MSLCLINSFILYVAMEIRWLHMVHFAYDGAEYGEDYSVDFAMWMN